ncbi:MAG: proprotein convertase P-domain-containing protein, partial [Cyanobacteria bacterium P01_H01_bin.35]
MKTNILESSTITITALTIILSSLTAGLPANSQPITPANDGTGTTVNQNGNQFNIQGGTHNGANLFHSFDKFNVHTNQTANFLTTPDIRNILGRVTGGNASYINGLIQVTGGNSNLFLMNPAGIMFGPNGSLNIPGSFSVTTATGIGFDSNNFWFKAIGTNDYSNLVGTPSGYRFEVSNPGAIVNEGNLSLNPGENLTLLGGTVINTGELSTAGGNINITAVAGGSILRISQVGHLLSLELNSSLASGQDISELTPLSLPKLLTGGEIAQATSVIVNANGDVVLTDSNTIVADLPGTAIAGGNIDVSTTFASTLSNTGNVGNNIGGHTNVLGNRVAVIDAKIDANGINGGGTVLIGGDFQGNGIVPNSEQTFVNNNSIISADATTNGNGGKVIIWSDGITNFWGNISAKGGEVSGDGGFVEVSGKQELIFKGAVDVTAALGTPGTILLDPENIILGGSESNTSLENSEGNIILQADNDITINENIETESSVELKAGRTININADIDTSVGNGNIDLLGNNDEMNIANRSDGAASINQLDGTILNAGSGTINIQLGNLGEVGDINLANLTTTGEVLVNANGGNIARISDNSLINAGSVLFETNGSGGIGLTNAPLRLDVENLEAVSGSGGVFFDVGNVNIGGVSEDVDGIVTAAGDIEIQSDGDVTLTETISTQEIVENNSEVEATENTEITNTNGSINIEATGDIVATGSGIKGGGESVSLSATNIRINDEFGETSGDADVKLEATNDITVEDIEDNVLEFLPGGGEIEFRADVDGDGVGVVEMLDNEADVDSDPNTFENGADTIKTNGRNLTIAGAGIILGNIDTSWLPVSSGGELLATIDVDEGGPIPLEGTDTATFTFTVEGDLGTIENLDVRFSAEHTFDEDLQVTLESPAGKQITLFEFVGGDGDNFQDTVLDDDASTSIASGNAPFNGTYIPQGSLGEFNGENPNGTWTLIVTDTFAEEDSGSLYRAGDTAPWGTAVGTQLLLRSPLVQSGGGNGGTINIEATHGDLSVGNIHSLSETANGGIVDLKANNNIITGLINSSSPQAIGGDINLNSISGNINTFSLDASSVNEDGANVTITAQGGISTTEINASVVEGNGGNISLTTEGDISTESLNSSVAQGNGNGGNISLTTEGDISTESLNSSVAQGNGNGGNISLTTEGDISTDRVDSSVIEGNGNGGNIFLTAGGAINTGRINSSIVAGNGNGGNIFLTADGAISTDRVESNVEEGNGDGGNISLTAGGSISTDRVESNVSAEGNGGDITFTAGGNISTEGPNSSVGQNGNGGDISLTAEGDLIIERTLTSNVLNGEGDGGDISLTASGNISTESVDSNVSGNGDGGNITFTAGGDIDTTQRINSRVLEGDGGNITLTAEGNINLIKPDDTGLNEFLDSSVESGANPGNGGNISVSAGKNITITASVKSSSGVNLGNGGNISVSAEGDITTGALDSSSVPFLFDVGENSGNGGAISVSAGGNITIEVPEALNSFSFSEVGNSGNGGAISVSAGGNITTGALNSFSASKEGNSGNGGNISVSAESIEFINPTELENLGIRTFAVGTNESGEGGDVNITIKSLSNGEILTTSSRQESGEVRIESQQERDLVLDDFSIITSKQVEIQIPNVDIITVNVGESGQSGDVFIDGSSNINLNNVNIQSDTKGDERAGDVTITSIGTITLDNSNIFAITSDDGDAGNITIKTPQEIQLTNGSQLQADTEGAGNAGTIEIQAQTLDLNQTTSLTTESRGGGKPGTINITANTIDIRENAQISATVTANSTNEAGGGNINIEANNLNISGALGIFAETAGAAEAGTLTLNPYKGVGEELGEFDPNLNITFSENGFISARTTSTGNGGNIEIFAPENINIFGEGSITVETTGTGKAGTINIDTQNLTIAENTTISASTSNSGEGGIININPTQAFQLEGQIITETTGARKGGTITIKTGEMSAPNSTISAKSTNAGNAGSIEITAQNNITTGIITSEANNNTQTADGGNISITSEQGEINATKVIQSFSNQGNAGDVTLQAKTDIITDDTISSHGQQQGGQITITSETGNIDTSAGTLANYSGGGNGGDVTMEAAGGNITANNIYTFADADGGTINLKAGNNINLTENTNIISASEPSTNSETENPGKGGDITLQAGNNINTVGARIYSGADDGDTGTINIIADGAIETGEINLASGFVREEIPVNNNFTLIPIPEEEATQGIAGNIIISSKNSTVDTSADKINSRSPDGSGDIIIEATGNITTGKLEASALNQEKPTTGGNIEIISRQGEIDATQPIETFSERGEGGSVALNAEGHVHTGSIRSEGMEKGGAIEIESRSQNSIEIIGNLSSYSTEGIAGNITLTSPGDINLQGIRSDGMQQGGRIKVESETGSIDATGGEIDSFSEAGQGGNIEINASESVNLGNVSSFGITESGNLTIQSQTAQVNTGNVTTQAPEGSSGSIIINAEEVGTGNLSSIGTTAAGEINVAATDGSIQTYAVEISSDGSIGALRLQATEDITTEDINQNAGAGDANIEINSGGDQTTGDINQTAENNTNNTQNAGGDITGDVNQNAGNNANNNQTAGGDIIGDVNQNAGENANNNQTAGGDIIGNVNQNAGENANNNQTAGGDIIGDVNQNAGNNVNNNQTAGGDIIGDVNQNAGNNVNNNQTAGGNIIGDVNQNAG